MPQTHSQDLQSNESNAAKPSPPLRLSGHRASFDEAEG